MKNFAVRIDYDTSRPSSDLRSYAFWMEPTEDAQTDGWKSHGVQTNTHRITGVFASEVDAARAALEYVGAGKIYRVDSGHSPRHVLSKFPPKLSAAEVSTLVAE